MEGMLTAITSVVTFLISQFTEILGLFATEPVLTICFSIFVVGAIIGLVTRLYKTA